jgi:RHH-type proline utilization regulon transcriptional repressor/proline dehydrogenase/delta 1-pyrroline-5-carboxylate dehydrogenase
MSLQRAKQRLEEVRGKPLSDEDLATGSVALAEDIMLASRRRMTRSDRRTSKKLARLVKDENGKAFTMTLADRIFRSSSSRRSADQFRNVISTFGLPKFLSLFERSALFLGRIGSVIAPGIVMPRVTARMRSESKDVILDSDPVKLGQYMSKRRQQGRRLNINQLGEAVLNQYEAARRLDNAVGRLQSDDVWCVSVKISSIFSPISVVDYHGTLEQLKERLRRLYRTAKQHYFVRENDESVRKMVYLDMEDYRDLHLTVDAFRSVLEEREFHDISAGIVLQAYLPDSYQIQKHLTSWAQERVKKGGRPIRLRIVKGANLAMEKVDASIRGWQLAPYSNKVETDANFKRMISYGSRPEHCSAVNLGVASHNLFDICYTLLIRESKGVQQNVGFEMLEGMANHQATAVLDCVDELLMYAPVVDPRHFENALAYLVRRLDENTGEENYLRDMFAMRPGDQAWEKQRERFLSACAVRDTTFSKPNRKQNRSTETPLPELGPFQNEPDTDFSLPANRAWLDKLLTKWQSIKIDPVYPVIDGKETKGKMSGVAKDPSRPEFSGYKFAVAEPKDAELALTTAVKAQKSWNQRTVDERSRILKNVAVEIAKAREDMIGCLILDAGKSVTEADSEISEAVDFANYYARSFDEQLKVGDLYPDGRGVVVVAPPWNFPYAIPAGGLLAALMGGNSVILKPAPQTVLTASYLAQQIWAAGVPKDVLQFVPCHDDETGKMIISDRRVDTVILTGAIETAELFHSWRPNLRVIAETSGKNSIIVTAAADQDLAIADIINSAFLHAGQKCSACSMVILEREVYESLDFRRQLRDAALSMHVGSAWNPASSVTPLISPPEGKLKRALTQLEEGEEWLLEPRMIDSNPNLWSPGIKLGVQPGSWFHQTECFGPVLGLISAKNLKEAIQIQNGTDFGLTAGIHSLDRREMRLWARAVEAGNGYINRSITGAIVRRQPFGGWKKSSFGPGAKAGGPTYCNSFVHWLPTGLPEERNAPTTETSALLTRVKKLVRNDNEREDLQVTAWAYSWAWNDFYARSHDPSGIHGERNILRYIPVGRMIYRINGDDDIISVFRAALAGSTADIPMEISLSPTLASHTRSQLDGQPRIRIVEESEADLASRLHLAIAHHGRRGPIRVPGGASDALHREANKLRIPIADEAIHQSGRVEIRYWLREQTISERRHRYGNII